MGTSSTAGEDATFPSIDVHDEDGPKGPKEKIRHPFWFGGSASCMAACFTHPLDLIKVRLQTHKGEGPRTLRATCGRIWQANGIRGFYAGLTASLTRQATYSTVRFGVYEEIKHNIDPKASSAALILAASVSGFMGGIAGNFADVINVRMQNDTALPPEQRRNYRNVVDGMIRMARQEGLPGYFRGWVPNSSRAAVQTAGQLASYDSIKRIMIHDLAMADNLTTQLSASFMAGVIATTATHPIDVIKSRVMSSATNSGVVQVIGDAIRKDGVRWMFRGWLPSFLRIGPHTMLTFLFLEAHRDMHISMYHKETR